MGKRERHIRSFNVGDKVAYSAAFIRMMGDFEMSTRRGKLVVVSFERGCWTGLVEWNDSLTSERVALTNLAKPGTVPFSEPSYFDSYYE